MPRTVPFGTRHRIHWPMRRRGIAVRLASWLDQHRTKQRARRGVPAPWSGSTHAGPSSSAWTMIGRSWSGSSPQYRPIVDRPVTSATTRPSATAVAARPRRQVNPVDWSTDRSSSKRSRRDSPPTISSSSARAPSANTWSDTSARATNDTDGRATSAAKPRRRSPTHSSPQDCATRRAWTREDDDRPGSESYAGAATLTSPLASRSAATADRRFDRSARAPDLVGIEPIGCLDRSIH